MKCGCLMSTEFSALWTLCLVHLTALLSHAWASDCDRLFIHTEQGSPRGTFQSPGYEEGLYPPNLQCVYMFIGRAGEERVQIEFEDFLLTGSKPRCEMDHLDIYSELADQFTDIIQNADYSGRYCGSISPGLRISLHHIIILVFHTQSKTTASKGFAGKYKFIPNDRFIIGKPDPNSVCGFTIRSGQGLQKTGHIISPSYPGKYPSNIHCWYKLIGEPDQRIKLQFEDFDLYFGGQHCPYDSVTIYDGDSPRQPIIQKACGLQQKLEIFSAQNSLYVEFNASDPLYSEHRGFKIHYDFSRQFVNIDQMIGNENGVEHMRGTECDLRVKSGKGTTHVIRSPNYPEQYPKNKSCTYILDGRQSSEDLEKVIISFDAFSIASSVGKCDDAFVAIYQMDEDPKNEDSGDTYCGQGIPASILSKGARLTLILKTGTSARDQGFQARVMFQTDFGIPGKPISGPDTCEFEFNSADASSGIINSPRYPSNYPQPSYCVYNLVWEQGQQVRLDFHHFDLKGGPGENDRCKDYIEIYNVFPYGLPDRIKKYLPPEQQNQVPAQMLHGKYCSNRTPAQVVSELGATRMTVLFRADAEGTSTGFKAQYWFKEEEELTPGNLVAKGCGNRIENSRGGLILSPNYGDRYDKSLVCNWVIKVRQGYRVLAQVMNITLEGEIKVDEATNKIVKEDCKPSVVLVYVNMTGPPVAEFCGNSIKAIAPQFLSQENELRISFLTAPDATGLEGFRIAWAEVKESSAAGCSTTEFKCRRNGWCLDAMLVCNNLYNCGENDYSDEETCKHPSRKYTPIKSPEDSVARYSSESETRILDAEYKRTLTWSLLGTATLLMVTGFVTTCVVQAVRRHRKAKRRRKENQTKLLGSDRSLPAQQYVSDIEQPLNLSFSC